MARGGTYARLHDLQFADDDLLSGTKRLTTKSRIASRNLHEWKRAP